MSIIKNLIFALTLFTFPGVLFAANDQIQFSINNATDVASASAVFDGSNVVGVHLQAGEQQVVNVSGVKTLSSVSFTADSTKLEIPCDKLKPTGKRTNNVRFVAWLVNAESPYQECHYWDYKAE